MTHNFVGSQPIQITSKNVNLVLGQNMILSPKLDGVRYNMIIGKSYISIVDRSGKETEKTINALPGVDRNTDIILDVEIIHTEERLADLVFVFDIISDDIANKPFSERLDILITMYNDPNSILSKASNTEHYIIVPKSFFYKKEVMGFDYKSLCMTFQSHYPQFPGLEFDGIIFMDPLYRYYKKSGVAYGQYKWKPLEDLTVDLTKRDDGNLHYRSNDGKTRDTIWSKLVNSNYPGGEVGKTYEYKIQTVGADNKVKIVELVREREDKGANSILTLETVYSAMKDYVSFDDIMNAFVGYSVGDKATREKALQFMKKEKASQFIYLYAYPKCFNELDITKIVGGMLKLYKRKHNEKHPITKQSQMLGKLMTDLLDKEVIKIDEEYDNTYEALNTQQISQETTSKVFYEFKVSLNKEYEVGFKKIPKKDITTEKILTRNLNISKKGIDVLHLIKRMNRYYTPKFLKEEDYITKRKIQKGNKDITIQELFRYDVVRNKYQLKLFKQYERDHLDYIVEIPSYLDYNIHINAFELGNKAGLNKEQLTKPERVIIANGRKLWKKSTREIYRYRLSKYYFLELVLFDEISYDTDGITVKRTLKKAFIDIEIKHEGIIEEFGRETRKEYYVKKRGRNVKVLGKPEFDYTSINDYVKESLTEVLILLFRNICF